MDHPRIRGERGRCGAYGPIDLGPPPRTRGTHGVASATATISRDHPRVRGERDVAHTSLGAVRGTTPAYAGNAPLVTLKASGRWDHPRVRGERGCRCHRLPDDTGPPRVRGERGIQIHLGQLVRGPPPRTRGTRPGYGHRRRSGGTTPAYAGNATRTSAQPGDDGDHPRVRGKRRPTRKGHYPLSGPPPRTRGTHRGRVRQRAGGGTTPAYAGNAPSCAACPVSSRDHPRVRGERPAAGYVNVLEAGPPPRTRGTHRGRVRQRAGGGTTPAYAGNAPSCAACPVSSTDHPRVRGECSCSRWRLAVARGPPPRTRGTP